jgi:hypothetical protein
MIGLSDNQLEVIMRVAAPLSEGKCQEFLERVAAAAAVVLEMRGQINDDDVAVAELEGTTECSMLQFDIERFRLPSCNYSINWVLAGFDTWWLSLKS